MPELLWPEAGLAPAHAAERQARPERFAALLGLVVVVIVAAKNGEDQLLSEPPSVVPQEVANDSVESLLVPPSPAPGRRCRSQLLSHEGFEQSRVRVGAGVSAPASGAAAIGVVAGARRERPGTEIASEVLIHAATRREPAIDQGDFTIDLRLPPESDAIRSSGSRASGTSMTV